MEVVGEANEAEEQSDTYGPFLPREGRSNRRRQLKKYYRALNEETDEEIFGLDQYASRIHLGKPGGHIHDVVLDPLRTQLLNLATEGDVDAMKELITKKFEEHADLFDKVEISGRFLWLVLRSPAHENKDHFSYSTRIWTAKLIIDSVKHGDRTGYLWGVFLDALNRSDLVASAEIVWTEIKKRISEDVAGDFVKDELFIYVARLSGLIDSFEYGKVETMLQALVNNAGPDVAAWAFTRCMGKYVMHHYPKISQLPMWDGKDLNQIMPLRAAHLSPLLADVGCVEKARDYWIKDHSSLYGNGEKATKSMNASEVRLEMEHLRAGLVVFARYPVLDAPHQEILHVIFNRFLKLLRAFPKYAAHNHGLLYMLARSDFYALTAQLAFTLLKLGSSRSIVGAAMCSMALRLGDFAEWRRWVRLRDGKNTTSMTFQLGDRYGWWLFKVSGAAVPDAIHFRLPDNKIPLESIVLADHMIRRRFAAGLGVTATAANPNATTAANPNATTSANANATTATANGPLPTSASMDSSDDLPSANSAISLKSHSSSKIKVKYEDPTKADIAKPYIRPRSLTPVSEDSTFIWQRYLESLVSSNKIGKQDLHSFHRTLISLLITGDFDFAEQVLIGPYRAVPPKQDAAVGFLLSVYAELRLFDRIPPFLSVIRHHYGRRSLESIVGEARVAYVYETLKAQDASPQQILNLWRTFPSPTVVLYSMDILSRASVAAKDEVVAMEIGETLFLQGVHHALAHTAIPGARILLRYLKTLNNNHAKGVAARVDDWLRRIARKRRPDEMPKPLPDGDLDLPVRPRPIHVPSYL